MFLPQGYPDSVSADYLSYQIWDTIQASILLFLMLIIPVYVLYLVGPKLYRDATKACLIGQLCGLIQKKHALSQSFLVCL